MTSTQALPQTLAARYQSVRDRTESLAAPLSPEDQVVQSMADVSPTKWHRAHVTWFFETFLLLPNLPGYEPVEDCFGYLFNSYYEAVGDRHPRSARGLISRPDTAAVTDYRCRVDDAMQRLIELVGDGSGDGAGDDRRAEARALIELGLHHEQQHQELLLMDIKHVLSCTPYAPVYDSRPTPTSPAVSPIGWVEHPGGVVDVGFGPSGADSSSAQSFDNSSFDRFSFDNEGPGHQALLHPHRLADRLVTNGEWLEFMAAGVYEDAGAWLSDGWHTLQTEGWDSPLYWRRCDDGWVTHTLTGVRPVDPGEPVVHISYYEAEAFARWAGARLPTEFEWESHARSHPVDGNLLSSGTLHPTHAPPPTVAAGAGPRQLYGDVWEWTSSAYAPYPGFQPAPGAVGEYNGKFMVDQQVLRGGSCVTPEGHVRATYRNFFPARARWMFGGLRLAAEPRSDG